MELIFFACRIVNYQNIDNKSVLAAITDKVQENLNTFIVLKSVPSGSEQPFIFSRLKEYLNTALLYLFSYKTFFPSLE